MSGVIYVVIIDLDNGVDVIFVAGGTLTANMIYRIYLSTSNSSINVSQSIVATSSRSLWLRIRCWHDLYSGGRHALSLDTFKSVQFDQQHKLIPCASRSTTSENAGTECLPMYNMFFV